MEVLEVLEVLEVGSIFQFKAGSKSSICSMRLLSFKLERNFIQNLKIVCCLAFGVWSLVFGVGVWSLALNFRIDSKL